jgi:hypothetical protein
MPECYGFWFDRFGRCLYAVTLKNPEPFGRITLTIRGDLLGAYNRLIAFGDLV